MEDFDQTEQCLANIQQWNKDKLKLIELAVFLQIIKVMMHSFLILWNCLQTAQPSHIGQPAKLWSLNQYYFLRVKQVILLLLFISLQFSIASDFWLNGSILHLEKPYCSIILKLLSSLPLRKDFIEIKSQSRFNLGLILIFSLVHLELI